MQFIQNKNNLRVWGDINGNLFLDPQIYNYIGANLSNGEYHLDELVEFLMSREDVAFITNSESSRYANNSKLLQCPLSLSNPSLSEIISDIPSYNSKEGNDETICLVFTPNTEQIKKMMNWEIKKETNYIHNLENYVIRELLGCEKFRKVPVVEVEPVVPKRKFKS
ncbi:hypothetical protein GW796_00065 [archaeon]|nr:hypothetical protein [archaeon]